MRQEYSHRKLFLGLTFRPENKARPSSATSGMTRLLCSSDQNLRARQARRAWAGGIILEPGSRAASAKLVDGQPDQVGQEQEQARRSRVGKRAGRSEKARTSATGFDGGAGRCGPFLIQAAGQGGEALGLQDFAHRRGAQGQRWRP